MGSCQLETKAAELISTSKLPLDSYIHPFSVIILKATIPGSYHISSINQINFLAKQQGHVSNKHVFSFHIETYFHFCN